MAIEKKEKITGLKKAAMLSVALGQEVTSNIFKYLSDSEIEKLTMQISNLRKLTPDEKHSVIEEFYNIATAKQYLLLGGVDYAREVLEKTFGVAKAMEIINRLSSFLEKRPFDFAAKADPNQLLNFLRNEHPQTIALVVAYLKPEQAAVVLKGLDPAIQVEVTKRIAMLDRSSPEIIKNVESVLERKLSLVLSPEYTEAGKVKGVVEILNKVDRSTEKAIIEKLEEEDPELAEEIKKQMFVFEDIVLLDDRSIQQVLREVEMSELALALKGAVKEVSDKIFKNISKRAGEMLREEIEYLGPARVKDVEEAQQRIVNTIRRLQDAGEIPDVRGGGGDVLV